MAEECDALFLMLGYPKDVEDVVLGSSTSTSLKRWGPLAYETQ
jgi:3-hydroxyisobutyrate dehydrogenase-like beta-hydroxyacid dehydrogenase